MGVYLKQEGHHGCFGRTHHGSVLSLSDLLLIHRLHHHHLLLLLEQSLLVLELQGLLHGLLVLTHDGKKSLSIVTHPAKTSGA